METIKLDIKLILTVIICIGSLGGFYYTTNLKLETLEVKVIKLEEQSESIIRLEERVKQIQKKTDETYDLLRDYLRSDSN